MWRECITPYYVVVSEVMLQQTQTYRVAPKFDAFINAFSSFNALKGASLQEVYQYWQGLGYNRRAKYLQEIARIVVEDYAGQLPADPKILQTFPGLGPATAASICAFAFNMPIAFIETNIRSVFIHHFFQDQADVRDAQLMPLIEQTLDRENPREWYYALMDYGVMLKKQHKNPSRKSKHHVKQSKFEGSNRQIRGALLRILAENGPMTEVEIAKMLHQFELQRIMHNLGALQQEKFIIKSNGRYTF